MPHILSGPRVLAGVLVAGWLTPVITVGLVGIGLPTVHAAIVALAIAIGLTLWLRPRIHALVDPLAAAGPSRPHPVWLALFAGAGLVAVLYTAQLAVFMANPARVDYSVAPSDPFRAGHSCFAAYAEGQRFAQAGDRNIYDQRNYRERLIGALRVDPYHYPPPFLLVPAALRLVAPDFAPLRAVWFMLQAMTLAIGLFVVSRWIGGVPGAWAAGASWLVLASPPVFQTYQFGNVQMAIVALSMVATVLAYNKRIVPAAALLGYAMVSKIFPGVLVLFLVASRRWRAAVAVGVASVLLLGATVLVFGWTPLVDFVSYELPGIANGDAFPQAERPNTWARNLSVYGETVRLRALGLTWLTPETGRTIASVYGLVVLLLAAAAGWRTSQVEAPATPAARLAHAQLWLAMLSLASFRSPFVGSAYGFVASLWLTTLLAAGASTPWRRAGWMAAFAALAGFAVYTASPTAGVPSASTLIVSVVAFFVGLVINLAVVIRAAVRRVDVRLSEAPVLLSRPPVRS